MATPAHAPEPIEVINRLLRSLELQVPFLDVSTERLEELGVFEDGWVSRREWEELQPFLAERQRQGRMDARFENFQRELREKLIHSWLVKELPKESDSYNTLMMEISEFVRWDRTEELYEYLTDVLSLGLAKARSNRKGRLRGSHWRYLGTLLFALLQIAVVFSIFSVAESRFQTIVFSLLVLLLISNSAGRHQSWLNVTSAAVGIDNQFRRIRRMLGKADEPDYERDAIIEAERSAQQKVAQETIRYYIRDTGAGVCVLIALWRLLSAIA
jgi:hypothetical protein